MANSNVGTSFNGMEISSKLNSLNVNVSTIYFSAFFTNLFNLTTNALYFAVDVNI